MSKGKILVVDDSPLVRKLAEVSLQERGYEVYSSADGEEGLKLAKEIRPDLILVDFIMPRMTGSQFCKLLRENEELKDTPMLLITGKGETVGQTFIEKYGVIDYFIKPFKSEDLIEKVEQTLNKIIEASYAQPLSEIPEEEIIEPTKIEETLEIKSLEDLVATLESKQREDFLIEEPKEEEKIEEELILNHEEISNIIPEELQKEPQKEEEKIEIQEPTELKISEELASILEIEEKIEQTKEVEIEVPFKEEIIEEINLPTMEEVSISKPEDFIVHVEEEKHETIQQPISKDIEEEFILKIFSHLDTSIESIFKKYGLIKEPSTILSGYLSFFSIEDIFSLISGKNLTGILYLYGKGISYEFLFIGGKIIYGVSSLQKHKMGGKVFSEISQDEIKKMILENINELRDFTEGNFNFELADFNDIIFQNRERYDFREFFR